MIAARTQAAGSSICELRNAARVFGVRDRAWPGGIGKARSEVGGEARQGD